MKTRRLTPSFHCYNLGVLTRPFYLHNDKLTLFGHPKVGASWEGYAIEQVIRILHPDEVYFWASHSGAELDLLVFHHGKRYGIEVKFNEAPEVTRSMHIVLHDLSLSHLWVIYPGAQAYPVHKQITVWPLQEVGNLAQFSQV